MTPSQYERLRDLGTGGLFQAFRQLQLGGLDPAAFDGPMERFTGVAEVAPEQVNALGLLGVADCARLMEDAAIVLGFVRDGELLMVTRYELDCLFTPGVGETLEVTVELDRRRGRLRGFRAEVCSAGTQVARATLVALSVTTLPAPVQERILDAARQGLVRQDVLLHFVHLFDPHRYIAVRDACRAAEEGQGPPSVQWCP